jgi:magnesium chelatase family protein
VEVAALTTEEISSTTSGEPSEAIRERVEAARAIQRERFRRSRSQIQSNAEMSSRQLRKYCELDPACRKLLEQALDRLALSARAYDRILKVARTIADLAAAERIESPHLSEAINYRALDRAYFRG